MPKRIPTYRPVDLTEARQLERQQYERGRNRRDDIRFYQSDAWRALRALKLAEDPACERCLKANRFVAARHVHHVEERKKAPELALELSNLESLCHPCHSRHHARQGFRRP